MKKYKAFALGATALVVFGLTACGVGEGTITQKSFEPSHSEEYTSCILTGKVNVCSPQTREVEDKWKFELSKETEDNKTRTGWVQVSHSDYDNYSIGDYYTISK